MRYVISVLAAGCAILTFHGSAWATAEKTATAATAAPSIRGATKSAGAPKQESVSKADTSMTLRGGQSGTELRSMTIEGEDRVHIDFGRPQLNLDLDPEQVSGLTRGTAADVLDRTVPDLATPLLSLSSGQRSPYPARPRLQQSATGAAARFRPSVK